MAVGRNQKSDERTQGAQEKATNTNTGKFSNQSEIKFPIESKKKRKTGRSFRWNSGNMYIFG